MGALRDTNTEVQYPRLDPFDLCDEIAFDVEPTRDERMTADSKPCRSKPLKNLPRGTVARRNPGNHSSPGNRFWPRLRGAFSPYLLVVLFVVASAVSVTKIKPWSYFIEPDLVYAYFEVRALDTDGRPIAGAVVKSAGKRVGTTDSFGEWRRYMKVPLGATVPVTLAKKSNATVLYATKNFAVPPFKPEKSEIELHSSVQLLVAEAGDRLAQTAVATLPHDMIPGLDESVKNTIDTDPLKRLPTEMTKSRIVREQVAVGSEKPKADGLAAAGALFQSDHETISFEIVGRSSDALLKDVLPALVLRARELGLRVDAGSPWKVRLSSLIDKPKRVPKDGGGLIMISSSVPDGKSEATSEFLRNYQSDARTTARGILFGLINHVNKNILITKRGARWLGVLPKATAKVWKLRPEEVVSVGEKPLVLGSEEYSDGGLHGYFIKNSVSSPCAENKNECVAQTRSFSEVAPVQGWKRLRLKVPQLDKDSIKIFVSGYEAKPIADRLFEYWGVDKATSNVTVVQNGKVLVRGHIVGDQNGAAVLGIQGLSRR